MYMSVLFHKNCYQYQMLNAYDKVALSQSNTTIPAPYNSNLLLIFYEAGPWLIFIRKREEYRTNIFFGDQNSIIVNIFAELSV